MKYNSLDLEGIKFSEEELENLQNSELFYDNAHIQILGNCLCAVNEISEIFYQIHKFDNYYQLQLIRVDNYDNDELIDSQEF